jgi:hypothetical protein
LVHPKGSTAIAAFCAYQITQAGMGRKDIPQAKPAKKAVGAR